MCTGTALLRCCRDPPLKLLQIHAGSGRAGIGRVWLGHLDPTLPMATSIPSRLLAAAEAADVRFNGNRPWDPQVHHPRLYGALLRHGSLALGDGYVRGDWDCDQIDEMICRLLQARANRPLSRRAVSQSTNRCGCNGTHASLEVTAHSLPGWAARQVIASRVSR